MVGDAAKIGIRHCRNLAAHSCGPGPCLHQTPLRPRGQVMPNRHPQPHHPQRGPSVKLQRSGFGTQDAT